MSTQESAIQFATVVAGEAIKKGDLIAAGSDGKCRYVVEPNTSEALFRPINQPVAERVQNSVLEQYFLDVNATDGTERKAMASVKLSDGGYAIAYSANGGVQVTTFSPSGTLRNKLKLGSTLGEHTDIAMTALDNSCFAVAYNIGDPAELNVVILNFDGTLLADAVSFNNITKATSVSLATLTDDSVVIAYAVGDNRSPAFARVNADGTLATASVIVENLPAGVTNNQSVSVCALTNGGFVITYATTDGTIGKVYAVLYNAAGEKIRSAVKVGEDQSLCSQGAFVDSASLTGGGFAVTNYGGIGPGFQLTIFDETATMQGSTVFLDPFDAIEKPNRMGVVGLSDGNVGVVWCSAFASSAVYSPTGVVVFPRSGYGLCDGSIAISAAEEGAVIAFQGRSTQDSPAKLYVGQVGLRLYGDITETTFPAGQAFSKLIVCDIDDLMDGHAQALIAGVCDAHVQIASFVSYDIIAQAFIGIAEDAADKDTTFQVQVKGSATLRTPFKVPYVIDANYQDMPGQKAAIVGDLVILKGIQS